MRKELGSQWRRQSVESHFTGSGESPLALTRATLQKTFYLFANGAKLISPGSSTVCGDQLFGEWFLILLDVDGDKSWNILYTTLSLKFEAGNFEPGVRDCEV